MKIKFVLYFFIFNLLEFIFSDLCFDTIKKLASKERCLSSRGEMKRQMAMKSKNVNDFISLTRNQTCTGTDFDSKTTTQWVSEIFEGIDSQFYDYANLTSEVNNISSYKSFIGEEIIYFFNLNNSTDSRIIYYLRHLGSHTQNWLIEKLKNKQGWIIYQSYEDAYTLNAWLSQNLTGMYNNTNGDIFMWRNLKQKVDEYIIKATAGNFSLYNYENITEPLRNMTPYFNFIKNYNESQVISNFEKSWNLFGKGQILDWDQFSIYLNLLSNITNFYYKYENTNFTYPNSTRDNWINLFGTPDQLYFTNISTNNITNVIPAPSTDYNFEIKYVVLPDFIDCQINDVFMNYLTTTSRKFASNIISLIIILIIFLL